MLPRHVTEPCAICVHFQNNLICTVIVLRRSNVLAGVLVAAGDPLPITRTLPLSPSRFVERIKSRTTCTVYRGDAGAEVLAASLR